MKTSTEIAREIAEKAAYDADEFMSIGYDSGDQFLVFDELGFTGHLAAAIEPMVRELVEKANAFDVLAAVKSALAQPKEQSGE